MDESRCAAITGLGPHDSANVDKKVESSKKKLA